MKISEAFELIEKSDRNQTHFVSEQLIELLVGQSYPEITQPFDRLTGYYLAPWFCTDTCVGLVFYFLDDRPLAAEFLPSRKAKANYEFASQEIFDEARKYVLSLVQDPVPIVSFFDPEKEIGGYFNVNYREQLLDYEGRLDGQPAKYLRNETLEWLHKNVKPFTTVPCLPGGETDVYSESIIMVELENGSRQVIHIDRFKIPYRTTKSG